MVVGSDYVVTTTFTDANGALANPATVEALIQAPDGTQTTPTPTSATTGVWVTTGPATQPGIWFYEITGDGVMDIGSFCVQPGLVPVS